ncbi:thioesterase family protein [Nesterenkonia pannonica]|uniref:thioesterase family protein n=1 Tax=Nesterenkonia pannonica TaxID=1548602 RepID=UPI0021642D78|nr:thioesterase family protein [Nesterenkonia pannonica]
MIEGCAVDLPEYRTAVREEWIDYNGHLSEAYYVLVFGFATDQAMEVLGMDAAYRQREGASLYTVEAHVRYLQEVPQGAGVAVRTAIVGTGDRKLHLAHEMHDDSGRLVATEEMLGVHVGGEPAGAQPFPSEVRKRMAMCGSGKPDWVGRAVRM